MPRRQQGVDGGPAYGYQTCDVAALSASTTLVAVHSCTRLGRRANPPRFSMADWFMADWFMARRRR
jgi:hypothetical protein